MYVHAVDYGLNSAYFRYLEGFFRLVGGPLSWEFSETGSLNPGLYSMTSALCTIEWRLLIVI